MDKKSKTWIIGCGDIGCRVLAFFNDQQRNNTRAIVRTDNSVNTCKEAGVEAIKIDLDKPYSLSNELFKDAEIFYFVPPASKGKIDNRLYAFLKNCDNLPKRIVLISTTGVYGDSQGKWIDELTPVNPKADRAYRRLSAEQALQDWAAQNDKEFMILRVPGIYAQNRLPLDRLKKGLPVVNKSEAGWTNRIHADDLAQACIAAMRCEQANHIINVTDGRPSSMTDYFNQIADFANLPRPPQVSMNEAKKTMSEGMISYLKESRRIKNNKMLEMLKIKLKYPDLASALKPHFKPNA